MMTTLDQGLSCDMVHNTRWCHTEDLGDKA